MFECPENAVIARQMHLTLTGRQVAQAVVLAAPHKFAFLNRPAEAYAPALQGTVLGEAYDNGSSLFLPCGLEWVLVFGEVVGRLLYHEPGAELPERHQLMLRFTDGSALTLTISMWAAIHLVAASEMPAYPRSADSRPTPLQDAFSWEYFQTEILANRDEWEKKSVKRMMVSKPAVQGVANGCLHDILWRARLHPKRPVKELSPAEQRALYDATVAVTRAMADAGGRDVERDLFGNAGFYHGVLGAWAVGQPCPRDGGIIEKIAYLGGTSYYCPLCQR